MATGPATPENSAVPLRHRISVSELDAEQLKAFRAAVADLLTIGDERGYQFFAGLHGLPLPAWCDRFAHGRPFFLHWHRAYLWRFELALRQNGKHDVSMPYWDWISEPGLPAAYADDQTPEGDANPLRSVRINDLALQEGSRAERPKTRALAERPDTFRQPGGVPLPTAEDIARVMAFADFPSFAGELENWHGQVHVWVGGHMSDVPFAAYDPIFWAHHTMIDKLWRIWQRDHPGASLPGRLNETVMQPFGVTAQGTLEPNALGYDYAISATDIPVN
jgi:tyrosinase